ncbi:putative glycosyl transferase [Trypanosoma vivax]|nr:putative glycosyl transferase [Trypanosoma vivax]
MLVFATLAVALVFTARRGRRRFPLNTIGFLHPSAASGGGGERVLWVAISSIQQEDIEAKVERRYILYCTRFDGKTGGGAADGEQGLLRKVQQQFQISLPRPVEIIYLRPSVTRWLNGECYPLLTLLLQTVWGSALLFYDTCIANCMTPIVIESVGIPGMYPLLSALAGARVFAYIHYPVITPVMTQRVERGEVRYNNRGILARHRTLRRLKVLYYQLFASLYRFMGQFPAVVMTNSTWTMRHVEQLWKPAVPILVYPPCAVSHFTALRKPPEQRDNTIVSVGQFRPEKNHMLQLHAFAAALPRLPKDARLVMIGGARNEEDRNRAAEVQLEAERLKIASRVDVRVDAPFREVSTFLTSCCIGLHTMEDEHFGIVLVEYIACGCIPLGHNSGGVRLDIVTGPDIGFLATTLNEYADCMATIFDIKLNQPDVYRKLQDRGLSTISRFSDESFRRNLIAAIRPHLNA